MGYSEFGFDHDETKGINRLFERNATQNSFSIDSHFHSSFAVWLALWMYLSRMCSSMGLAVSTRIP